MIASFTSLVVDILLRLHVETLLHIKLCVQSLVKISYIKNFQLKKSCARLLVCNLKVEEEGNTLVAQLYSPSYKKK